MRARPVLAVTAVRPQADPGLDVLREGFGAVSLDGGIRDENDGAGVPDVERSESGIVVEAQRMGGPEVERVVGSRGRSRAGVMNHRKQENAAARQRLTRP